MNHLKRWTMIAGIMVAAVTILGAAYSQILIPILAQETRVLVREETRREFDLIIQRLDRIEKKVDQLKR